MNKKSLTKEMKQELKPIEDKMQKQWIEELPLEYCGVNKFKQKVHLLCGLIIIFYRPHYIDLLVRMFRTN